MNSSSFRIWLGLYKISIEIIIFWLHLIKFAKRDTIIMGWEELLT